MGQIQPISGVMNTLAAGVAGWDYTDLFFATGGSVRHAWPRGATGEVTLELRLEDHGTGKDVVSDDPSDPDLGPALPIREGSWSSIELGGRLPGPWAGFGLGGRILAGRFEGDDFGRISGQVSYQGRWLTRGTEVKANLEGGALLGSSPRQALYLFGGRGSVPGYPFRTWVGDGYWLLRTEASMEIAHPFLRLRALGAAGGTVYGGEALADPWPGTADSPLLLSAGLGIGLGWDVLRLDLSRGLRRGGDWELVLSVNHDFWPWL
jgi:hypothetical protein